MHGVISLSNATSYDKIIFMMSIFDLNNHSSIITALKLLPLFTKLPSALSFAYIYTIINNMDLDWTAPMSDQDSLCLLPWLNIYIFKASL